jgi:hypothetical protein
MSGYTYAISPAIGIALSSMIVYYLYSLERLGCQCSLTGKRAYILGFNSLLIAFNLFILGMGGADGMASLMMKYPFIYIIYFLIGIGQIVNVAFTIEFVNDMKREKCACSDSVFKDIMYILSIIQAITISISFIVGIIIGIPIGKDIAAGKITIKNIQRAAKAVAAKRS